MQSSAASRPRPMSDFMSSHVDEANDYRMASEGAAEVAAPAGPEEDESLFFRWWRDDVRRLTEELKKSAAELAAKETNDDGQK